TGREGGGWGAGRPGPQQGDEVGPGCPLRQSRRAPQECCTYPAGQAARPTPAPPASAEEEAAPPPRPQPLALVLLAELSGEGVHRRRVPQPLPRRRTPAPGGP